MKCWPAVPLLIIGMLALPPKGRSKPNAILPCGGSTVDPEKLRRPSPPGCSDIKFADGGLIVVQYSRPKLRNPDTGRIREVFGSRVPWGEVWRAGANEATSFTTNANLIIGNQPVPAGAYTLYLIPQHRKPWTLILNKTTGQWGMPYPGKSSDLARIDMETALQRDGEDQLTIEFGASKEDSTILSVTWENWKAAVTVVEAH